MPIVFNCPHCGEGYRLKDDLAGKKATCKNAACRKVFTVPAASAPMAVGAKSGPVAPVDAEALALAAFAEDTAKIDREASIPMVCKNCDHAWEVELNKQGKNVVCPECRTMNKVPIPKKGEQQDWRQANQGIPEGAKENFKKLEGVVAAGAGGYVSGTSIEAAGAAPKIEYEPRTFGQKLIVYGIPLLLVCTLAGGFLYYRNSKKANLANHQMADALAEVTGPEGSKLSEYHALAHMAMGEFKARAATTDPALEAGFDELRAARGKLGDGEIQPVDRGLLIVDLAALFGSLAGDKAQVDANTRKSWEQVQKEVRQTLDEKTAQNPDENFRIYAIDALSSHWIESGKGPQFAAIVGETSAPETAPDLMAFVGLEMVRAKKPDEAGAILGALDAANLPPFGLALRLATNQPPDKDIKYPADSLRLAQTLAAALSGKLDEAKALLAKTPAAERCRTAILASVLANGSEATALAEIAVGAKVPPPSPWLAFLLMRQLQAGGKDDLAAAVAKGLTDESAALWAKVLMLKNKGAADPNAKFDDAAADEVAKPDAPKLAASYCRMWIARRNSKRGDKAYPAKVEKWDRVTARPFGLFGAVLGEQDRTVK